MTFTCDRMTGYAHLGRLWHGMTPRFFTCGREFGLWYVHVHGFGLEFEIIGPFRFRGAK